MMSNGKLGKTLSQYLSIQWVRVVSISLFKEETDIHFAALTEIILFKALCLRLLVFASINQHFQSAFKFILKEILQCLPAHRICAVVVSATSLSFSFRGNVQFYRRLCRRGRQKGKFKRAGAELLSWKKKLNTTLSFSLWLSHYCSRQTAKSLCVTRFIWLCKYKSSRYHDLGCVMHQCQVSLFHLTASESKIWI